MKIRKLDWKFTLGLAATIVLGILPYIQSYFQTPERELSVRLISQSSLDLPANTAKPLGLEITIDKIPVKSPYLTVLEISNTGSKPIRSEDFERKLTISISKEQSLIRTQVSNTIPKDLNPKTEFDGHMVSLDPILLNPKDTIMLTVLNSGGSPSFEASARIAGIAKVRVEKAVNEEKNYPKALILFLTSIFVAIVAVAVLSRHEFGRLTQLNSHTALLVYLITIYISIYTLRRGLEILGYTSMTAYFIGLFAIIIIATPPAIRLERRSITKTEMTKSES